MNEILQPHPDSCHPWLLTVMLKKGTADITECRREKLLCFVISAQLRVLRASAVIFLSLYLGSV